MLSQISITTHARARRVKIWVEGSVVRVTKPRFVSKKAALELCKKERGWIESELKKQQTFAENYPDLACNEREHFMAHKEEAERKLKALVSALASRIGVDYQAVRVRRYKRQWGSCSSRGVISLNYKLLFLPSELRDYVVVHELCHRRHLNHGPRFWALVEKYVPEFQKHRQALQAFSRA